MNLHIIPAINDAATNMLKNWLS